MDSGSVQVPLEVQYLTVEANERVEQQLAYDYSMRGSKAWRHENHKNGGG